MLNRLRTEESGIALVLALMTMIVLGILSTTVIFYSTQSAAPVELLEDV